jgi:integrase
MEGDGASKTTVKETRQKLNQLSKLADLENPETVKQAIAKHECSESYKYNLTIAYHHYATYYKIEWIKPKYEKNSKQFQVPTTEKIDFIISASHDSLATKLRISKEAGLRPVEIVNLTPKMIDIDHRTITPNTAKHGAPRTLPISQELCNTLKGYITQHNIQLDEKLFPISAHTFSTLYIRTRNHLAKKLNDPSIRKIRLYDIRHYFGTKTMQKTGSVPITAYMLGHREWKSTQVYIDILTILKSIDQDYTSAVATTEEQALKLIEQGFEYITDWNNNKLFRKRK